MRNQRNRFMALISAAGQAQREMAERLRLRAAEHGVLQGEAADKARVLAKVRGARGRGAGGVFGGKWGQRL